MPDLWHTVFWLSWLLGSRAENACMQIPCTCEVAKKGKPCTFCPRMWVKQRARPRYTRGKQWFASTVSVCSRHVCTFQNMFFSGCPAMPHKWQWLTHTHTHANMHAHTCEVRGGMTQRSSAFCSMLIRVLPFAQLNTFMLAQCHDRDPGTPCHTMPYHAIPGHIAPYNHTHLSPTGCEAYFIGFCLPVKRMEQNTRAHVRIVVI